MREIKFRLIDTKSAVRIDPREFFITDSEVFIYYSEFDNSEKADMRHHDILQYIGLKDKNGTEIYEGDIVENASKDLKFQVVYEAPSFNRKWIDGTSKRYREHLTEPLAWNTYMICEVIGNIYENPELLEGLK